MKSKSFVKVLPFFGVMLLVVFAYSFTSPKDNSSKENDKNIVADDYPSVIIGTQEWMTENLNVDVFRNGDPIPEAKSNSEWEKASDEKKPAWCYYDNDPSNGQIYGKLYNWYAVNDPRGLAPESWHIPTDEEWTVLTEYLTEKELIKESNTITFWYKSSPGGKMKSTGTQYWESPNKDASNSSGFSGLPGGMRGINGDFDNVGSLGFWWSSSEYDTLDAWSCYLNYSVNHAMWKCGTKYNGYSVRCLRD